MPRIIFILTLLFSFPARSFDYGEFISCDALNPEPRIIFKTSFGQLIHDVSTPQAQIQSKSSATPEKGHFVAGLATLDMASKLRIASAKGVTLDENHYCIMPEVIEVYLGFKNPTIYVASEYPKDSCRFSLIIRHEQTHQRINVLTLQYFLPLIDKTLTKAINEVRSVKVANKQDATPAMQLLQNYYIAKITPIVEEFEKARQNEQKKLDNIENYTMEDDLCKNYDQEHGLASPRIK